MTIIAAITGGMGSGKSTFSEEVKKRQVKLMDSDELVRKIYENPDKNFLKHLRHIGLGQSIKRGRINKSIISKIIFSDTKIKFKLEKFIFNIIREKRKNFIKKEKKIASKIIFFDIPLLFENNLSEDFDIVISIISTKKNRYNRLKKSKKMSKTLFNSIIKSQTTDVERKKNSDFVIFNNSSLKLYQKKINNTLNKIII